MWNRYVSSTIWVAWCYSNEQTEIWIQRSLKDIHEYIMDLRIYMKMVAGLLWGGHGMTTSWRWLKAQKSTWGSADSTGKAPRGREREWSRWAERSPTYSPDTYNSKEPGVSANHSGFFFLGFQTGIEKASWDHCKEQHTNRPADQCKRHHCEFFKLDSNSLVLSK